MKENITDDKFQLIDASLVEYNLRLALRMISWGGLRYGRAVV